MDTKIAKARALATELATLLDELGWDQSGDAWRLVETCDEALGFPEDGYPEDQQD